MKRPIPISSRSLRAGCRGSPDRRSHAGSHRHDAGHSSAGDCHEQQLRSLAIHRASPRPKKHRHPLASSTGRLMQGSDSKTYRDPDWENNMWWEDNSDGDTTRWKHNTGNGWNQNPILPIAPDPITGQQAFHSTVVSLRKI